MGMLSINMKEGRSYPLLGDILPWKYAVIVKQQADISVKEKNIHLAAWLSGVFMFTEVSIFQYIVGAVSGRY